MKTKQKKVIKIEVFMCILILISVIILTKPLNNLDEIWNYNSAKNIAEGRVPYKDFNIITTPLLPIICGIILSILGNELIVMRFIAILLSMLIIFLAYKILKQLKINNNLTYLSILLLACLYRNYFCIDYNFAILAVTLLAILLELKQLEKTNEILNYNFKSDFILGIIVGTTILFKQTTGIFISIIFIFYKLLMASKKENFIKSFKIIFSRLFGILVPVIILTIYLTINGIWREFLDYAILGIQTFSNKISYINLINNSGLIILLLSILVPIIMIYMYYVSIVKKQETNEQKNIFILFAYSVGIFITVFPISDIPHFLIGAMPALITFIYAIWILINKDSINKIITIILFLIIVTIYIILISKNINKEYSYSNINHFSYIPSKTDKKIQEIDNFIQEQNYTGKKVHILDASAAIYMIPLDKYNKDYDMFLKGNIGAKGEERTNRKNR